MMSLFTQYILPKKLPDLTVIWFRTPDNTEHAYGPGSSNYKKALASQDARLGELQAALVATGLDRTTNIVVVSDHAHSNVSGPTSLFPLRGIVPATAVTAGTTNASLGPIDAGGWSVSGDVRSADLLTFAGFKAYDGSGCTSSPMAGITSDGVSIQPVRVDVSGALCGKPNTRFQAISATLAAPVADFRVPPVLPPNGIVIAARTAAPTTSTCPATMPGPSPISSASCRAARSSGRSSSTAGTVPCRAPCPLDMINLENVDRKDQGQPDVIAGFAWDATAFVNGVPGTEFESFAGNRGMHGSFSPIDVHNTLLAAGPGFKSGTTVSLPSGNVDVAPHGRASARARHAAGRRSRPERGAGAAAERFATGRRAAGCLADHAGHRPHVQVADRPEWRGPRSDAACRNLQHRSADQGADRGRPHLPVLRFRRSGPQVSRRQTQGSE